jgi:hypothetical protein
MSVLAWGGCGGGGWWVESVLRWSWVDRSPCERGGKEGPMLQTPQETTHTRLHPEKPHPSCHRSRSSIHPSTHPSTHPSIRPVYLTLPSRRYSGATVTAVTCPCHSSPLPSDLPMTVVDTNKQTNKRTRTRVRRQRPRPANRSISLFLCFVFKRQKSGTPRTHCSRRCGPCCGAPPPS